jgi:hypothetical protein
MPDPNATTRALTNDPSLGPPRQAEPETAPPSSFPVSVIMERRRVSDNRWLSERWSAIGVTVGGDQTEAEANPQVIVEGPDAAQCLWRGLTVDLFVDEAESYYHNLMVGTPGCYIVTRPRADGMPEPVIVSLSFDAGQAYSEGDETVHNVALPAELYRAAEAFVLAHYVPEKKKKRKRTNWKEQSRGESSERRHGGV